MNFLSTYLDNRELAILAWLIILFMFFLTKKDIRKSFFNVIKSILKKKILVLNITMTLYVLVIVYGFKSIGLWNYSYLSDTVIWFFGVAFVMFMNVNNAGKDDFFKKHLIENLKLVILLEFLLNFFVFSFWIEILFVPTLLFIGGMLGVSSAYKKFEQVETLLTRILGVIGLGLLGYTIYKIITDYQSIFTVNNLILFLMPIVLTILLIPLIYFYALFATYELLFLRMNYIIRDDTVASYAKKKTFRSFLFNLWSLKDWAKNINISSPQTNHDVIEAIKSVKLKRA